MTDESTPVEVTGRARYKHLPAPVKLEDTVAEHEVRPVPDPDGGKDPEQLFLLRYGAL